MNIKNRKGITVAVLVITFLVMAALFSITFTTSMRLLKTSQKKKMKTMLYMVKSRAEILLDEYLFENEGKDLSEVMITDIQVSVPGTTGVIRDIVPCAWNEKINAMPDVGVTIRFV